MSFVFGALGAVAVFGVFALGALTGWKLRARFFKITPVEPPSDQQLREIEAQREAFRQMQNYNADVAYGIRPMSEGLGEGDTE